MFHTAVLYMLLMLPGVEADWSVMPDGYVDYTIQVTPLSLSSAREGDILAVSDIPPEVAGKVRSIKVLVNSHDTHLEKAKIEKRVGGNLPDMHVKTEKTLNAHPVKVTNNNAKYVTLKKSEAISVIPFSILDVMRFPYMVNKRAMFGENAPSPNNPDKPAPPLLSGELPLNLPDDFYTQTPQKTENRTPDTPPLNMTVETHSPQESLPELDVDIPAVHNSVESGSADAQRSESPLPDTSEPVRTEKPNMTASRAAESDPTPSEQTLSPEKDSLPMKTTTPEPVSVDVQTKSDEVNSVSNTGFLFTLFLLILSLGAICFLSWQLNEQRKKYALLLQDHLKQIAADRETAPKVTNTDTAFHEKEVAIIHPHPSSEVLDTPSMHTQDHSNSENAQPSLVIAEQPGEDHENEPNGKDTSNPDDTSVKSSEPNAVFHPEES